MTTIDLETMEIHHTQGDTFERPLRMFVEDNEGTMTPYVPAEGDVIRIAIKSAYTDPEPLILKEISHDPMIVRIEAEETKLLQARKKPYVYDIQLTTPAGIVQTFMAKKLWYSTEEVD